MTCREARKEKPKAGGVLFFVTVFCRWSEIGWPSCFFYSFYYLTISRWLFPFSKFLLCLWRVATEAPPFWIRVESWGEKCVRSRFSFQFLTRRSISTRQKKQKKHVGALQKNPVRSQTKKKRESNGSATTFFKSSITTIKWPSSSSCFFRFYSACMSSVTL